MTRSPQIMVLDPELCKEVLITNFKCFQDNESSIRVRGISLYLLQTILNVLHLSLQTDRVREAISGNNPFVLPFAEWKLKRPEIVPGLTSSKVLFLSY